jgi:ParB-like chromosome segregation protein Spo0J
VALESSVLAILYQPAAHLKPSARNARTHSKHQIRQIAESIKTFGFTNPVLIDSENRIAAGHGRVEAAKLLGIDLLPTIRLESLTDDQLRAYIIADNRLAERAGWDESILAIEFQHLLTISDIDPTVTGFEVSEIDLILNTDDEPVDSEDVSLPQETAISRPGDIWKLGDRRIICGNSVERTVIDRLIRSQGIEPIRFRLRT